MFTRIADNRENRSLSVKLRRKRFALFLSLISGLERPVHILDIGGTESFWRMMELDPSSQVIVTLLNLTESQVTLPNITSITGDARSLNMSERSFEVVFSNSVIEHLGAYNDQLRMASEVRRVGKRYFIQTPNRFFPLEPHFLFPFFQFLPIKIRVWLIQNFNLGWIRRTPDLPKAMAIVESIRLLDKNEFASLFPGAAIHEEKVLGLTKSFVAVGGWD